MRARHQRILALASVSGLAILLSCIGRPTYVQSNPAVKQEEHRSGDWGDEIEKNSNHMLQEGRQIFRHETFGSEAFGAASSG